MRFKSLLILFASLALTAMACSWSVDLGASKNLGPEVVPTLVEQTMEALRQKAAPPTATSTATPAPTPTPTNAPEPSSLSVSTATTCYGGPSSNYGRVITIYPGMMVAVSGRDTPDNYWIVEVPGYPGSLCWLSGQYAQVTGDTAALPVPATPLASRYTLSEPRNLRVSCTSEAEEDEHGSDWTVVFRWTNTEPDQTGVRVFRNGRQIATLGPHRGSYTDSFFHRDHHRGVTYGVQVFNSAAMSSIVTINVHHCD
jgi:hypothetical protein